MVVEFFTVIHGVTGIFAIPADVRYVDTSIQSFGGNRVLSFSQIWFTLFTILFPVPE